MSLPHSLVSEICKYNDSKLGQIYAGKHEAIISEEDWNLAQVKRKKNAFRREKVNDPDHVQILSGLLKCPCCGKSLYGNIAKAHSKDNKTRYYYYCKNTTTAKGHKCTFRVNIEQTELDRMVSSIISAMVNDQKFAEAIQAKIGTAVNTDDLEKERDALRAQLRQAVGTKTRLEQQMDALDVTDTHYENKILDLQRRYDAQYDVIAEVETQIEDIEAQIRNSCGRLSRRLRYSPKSAKTAAGLRISFSTSRFP